MGSSLERLIVMIIAVNLIVGLASGFAESITAEDLENDMDTFKEEGRDWHQEYEDRIMEINPDTQSVKLDNTALNVEFGQRSFAKIMLQGMAKTYTGCTFRECENDRGVWISNGIALFLLIINVIIGFNIFLIIYTKKNN